MKFGIAIPLDIFLDKMSEIAQKICESFGGKAKFLEYLGGEADAVELRVIRNTTNADELENAARICADNGLEVTIHGWLGGVTTAEEFFCPYIELFGSGLQSLYNITVHPFDDMEETGKLLEQICDYIEAKALPARITLENQRYSKESRLHNLCSDVAMLVKKINSPHLFTCFDFGHQLSNIRNNGEEFDVADGDFMSLVRHTHIHSLFEGRTHFPLNVGETLLGKNLPLLIGQNYGGIFLLELGPARYCDRFDIKDTVIDSLSILKTAAYQAEKIVSEKADYEKNFLQHVENVKMNLQKSGCGLGVLGPSGYIVKLGDVKIAVDVSLWGLPVNDDGTKAVTELLKECTAIVITHHHKDHFDKELIENLDVLCFIPDFMPIEGKNIVLTKDGFEANVGNVKLTFYESAHSLGENVVQEYGFAVNYDGKNYIFPTDVRDYKKAHKVFDNAECLVAHLWLGRKNALSVEENEYVEKFCEFVNNFKAEKILIGHMYDIRRDIYDSWTDIHYKLIEDKLTNCKTLRTGDWVKL